MRKSVRHQMQQADPSSPPSCSSTSDCFPLSNTAQCGSAPSVEPEKRIVRANPPHLCRMPSIVSFYVCYLLCLGLSLACMVCVCLWNSRWRGGFAWDGSSLQFNWHPVLMVTGLIVLYGNGAVLYRIPLSWGHNKLPWKLLHATVMLLALVLSIVGLCAVFDYHNVGNTPNLYSLHSWIGFAATALFAIQWVVGLAGFLLPCSPASLRALLKPVHVWMGGSILWLSIAACISGINEKLFFVLGSVYAALPLEAVLANVLGVLIVAFGLVVLKILSNHEWQRPESGPEDLVYAPLHQEEHE
ncbi:lysosomal membrane ascorbate-dependent ferrireductase CYB561A3 isoform X1 [Pseudoliparis swirei]|uniref:lysosomal membrane ascorbate-dependent ferrireductase CYB561A3 isoform X1 n=2 Tax=Pseudoliparis swirei TaxID=2059687 RepID=UPI0024BE0E01|nr:lysosomal membrane ascorbate-dependent ferrireductase CYB561A3 isoform X1 [Pseudoliparis swirei]